MDEFAKTMLQVNATVSALNLPPEAIKAIEQKFYEGVRIALVMTENHTALMVLDLVASFLGLSVPKTPSIVQATTEGTSETAIASVQGLMDNFSESQQAQIKMSPFLIQLLASGFISLVKMLISRK